MENLHSDVKGLKVEVLVNIVVIGDTDTVLLIYLQEWETESVVLERVS